MRRARPWWWFCTTSTSPPATPITSLPCAGAGPCIREPRSRSSVTRCCAISTRWISACTRSTGSGSACTFEWAEAGRRPPAPGANGAGGFRTEAVLLQQIPISSLALSLQEHPPPGANGCGGSHRGGAPTAGPDILVSSVLAGAPAPGANGCGGSHRGGAPTAGPDILVSSVLAGAPAPGANGAGGFRTEAVLLQQVPISSLALSLQEHPPRVRMGLAVFAPRRCSYSRSRSPR